MSDMFGSATIISIHALLAESDLLILEAVKVFLPISIHALLAESDNNCSKNNTKENIFLSTLSLRRATHTISLYILLIR